MIKKREYEHNNFEAINAHAETAADNEKQLLRLRKFKADRYWYRNIGLFLLSLGLFAILLSIAYAIYKKYYGVEPVIETKIVEIVKEVPIKEVEIQVVERIIEVPVPGEQKIIKIPGPSKIIKVPGPERIVIKKVPIQAEKELEEFVLFNKFTPNEEGINKIIVGKKYKDLNSMFPYEQYCYAEAKPKSKIEKRVNLSVKLGLNKTEWVIDKNTNLDKDIKIKLVKISRKYCEFSTNPRSKIESHTIPFPKSKSPTEGTLASGSGFYVNKEGYALTNNHVVENCNTVWIKDLGGTIPASVVKTHIKNDLAIIKVNKSINNFAKFSSFTNPVEDVMALGYPRVDVLGDEIKRNKGSVSSLTGMRGDNFSMQHTALIQQGSSGGPLVNKQGAIVGVNYAKFTDEDLQGIGLAIKSVNAIDFLGGSSVEFSLVKNEINEREWLDVFKEAERFTIRVLCSR